MIKIFYKNFLKKIYFRQDPEEVHDKLTKIGTFLGSNFFTSYLTRLLFYYSDKSLEQEVLGIKFKNPVGLAAGFDKDAYLMNILPQVGFGFEEIGSITGEKCEGNPRPRLWRLKKSEGLVVYYGLKNEGAEAISLRLKGKKFKFPIGISVAKTNSPETVETKDGIKDYLKAYNAFLEIGDYYTINISCPNAFGGQPFTDPEKLELLLSEIDKAKRTKPIFVKLNPDLSEKEIDDLLNILDNHKIDGIVATNLTKNRNNKNILDKNVPEVGGMSGKVVKDLANDLVSYIYKKTKGKYIIIAVGGIFSAEDAYERIKNGATLVQLITGMIFEGPQLVSDINKGLVKLLKKDGYKNISEAVGKNVR